jgi:hypothetical protein
MTIFFPVGVLQAPVEKTENVALKKLVSFGTFRLIPYLRKNWHLSTLNLPVQELNSKSGFFGK